jgi:hypothetical protein
MLELDDGQKVMEELWQNAQVKVDQQLLEKDFFAKHGPEPVVGINQRAYHRFFMRGKAVLKRGPTIYGTYTKDVSRQGVGFLSPVQLMPKERVALRLPVTELGLEVARCRRVDKGCYECGARFAL